MREPFSEPSKLLKLPQLPKKVKRTTARLFSPPFRSFLAAPFIATTGLYTERKFSGGDEAGNNIDDVGRAIDAFAHHVLVDSMGAMVLSDLQGFFFPPQ